MTQVAIDGMWGFAAHIYLYHTTYILRYIVQDIAFNDRLQRQGKAANRSKCR